MNKRTVVLTHPIGEGKDAIQSVEVRKPMGGDYRGLSMRAIDALDFDSVFELLTRITTLTLVELNQLHPCDIRKFTETLTIFFAEDIPEVADILKQS